MEAIYFQDLQEKDSQIVISGSEAKHLKALHLKINESILITNGKGLTAKGIVKTFNKGTFTLVINEFFHQLNESQFPIALGLGILSDRNRFEFALEKAVELGITDFFPLITKYTQKDKINTKRLIAKSIAAMKQCKRSLLTTIHQPVKINNLLKFNDFNTIILTDDKGDFPENKKINHSVLVLVGPEGGFDEKELTMIENNKRTLVWKLAERRLRAETAVISALTLI